MLMDTQQEKDIGLAPDYPFEPLKAGECLVPAKFKKAGAKVGGLLEVYIHNRKFMDVAVTTYNEEENPRNPAKYVNHPYQTRINCTIVDFLDENFGKYGEDNIDNQIIMEYNEFFPWVNTYLPNKLTRNSGFIEWLSEPKRNEQFAAQLMYILPGDRVSYYQHSEVATMRKGIYDKTNEITKSMGFYPLICSNGLLKKMTLYN